MADVDLRAIRAAIVTLNKEGLTGQASGVWDLYDAYLMEVESLRKYETEEAPSGPELFAAELCGSESATAATYRTGRLDAYREILGMVARGAAIPSAQWNTLRANIEALIRGMGEEVEEE